MDMIDTARAFLVACETGQGWDGCRAHCRPDAGFRAQAAALAGIETAAAYTEWMKGLLTMLPDGTYHLTGFAADAERDTVIASAVFSGTHTGQGGPVPPTGRQTRSDYVYVMKFEEGRLAHLTKIWNADWALHELGWL